MAEASASATEIAKGSAWSLAGSISFNLISFIYVIFIANSVPQEALGLFYLAIGMVTLAGFFDNPGTEVALARYAPYFRARGEHGKIRVLLRFSYLAVSTLAILFSIALWLASGYIGGLYNNPELPEALRMLSALLLLTNLFEVSNGFLRGASDMRGIQLSSNAQNLLKLVLTVVLFGLFGPSVLALSAAYVASVALANVASFFMVSAHLSRLPRDGSHVPGYALMLEVAPFCIMMTLLSSLSYLSTSLDRVLLGYLAPPAEANAMVAVYSMASMIAMLVMLFPASVGSIFLPVMSRLHSKNNTDEMREMTETSTRWLLFLMVPVSGVMFAFSEEMLAAFYGDSYSGGALSMSVIVVAALVRSLSSMHSIALSAMKRISVQVAVLLVNLLIICLLDTALIPEYGMAGPAYAFLAGSAFTTLALLILSWREFGFRFSPAFFRLLVCALLTFLLAIAAKPLVSQVPHFLPEIGGALAGQFVSKAAYLVFLGILMLLSLALFASLALLLRCFEPGDAVMIGKAMRKARMPEWAVGMAGALLSLGAPRK